MKHKIQLFEGQQIRTGWDFDIEEWLFSIVDVVAILTDSTDPQAYWRKLKQRLIQEGNETVTNCHRLRMKAKDDKQRITDVATISQLLRIIQSIPSKKAEPFKLWLASVGSDRINEAHDPELTIDRAMREYYELGYSEEWINTRLQSIQFRKELTDEWKRAGMEDDLEYAVLTNLMSKEWSGMSVSEYKRFKGLQKENLRDNMTSLELALNILAEASASAISKVEDPQGFDESAVSARDGARIAGNARKQFEERTGTPAISSLNAKGLPGRLNTGNSSSLPADSAGE
ncbi:MAG: hypothetical protein FWE48_06220 [Coriobacteriia bacterium]|nr:hypothetical protein [Coriobacteriia bacterium]